MERTPLINRTLPNYTKGEECMNMITHIVGGGLSIFILVICIITAAAHHNVWGVVSGAIYGFCLIALYSVSSVYHGLRTDTSKKVMQVIDHCTIYFLIAGTYTPILLSAMRPEYPVLSWVVFGAEWGFALLGAALNGIDLKKYSKFSMICYIAMGWLIVAALKPTIAVLTMPGFLWLLAGGVAYTLGAVLYGLGKKKAYLHSVFHIFVIFGSILQAVSIIFYVL